MRQARFEIVRTEAGHHARFVAANGRTVWTTEVYERRQRAVDACLLLSARSARSLGRLEVRDVDERR